MPSINDIAQIAESLEKSPVFVARDRCVAVRNRNALCRCCVGVCPVDAIEVRANEIKLDAGLCMACGACTSVCPTEALIPLKPTDEDLASAAAAATVALEGHTVFACARISSKHLADPSLYAEVPCLARLDESIVLSLASRGAEHVTFVDGTCETCKYGACVPVIDATMLYSNELLAAHGSATRVERASEFPDATLVENSEGLFGSTRRGFFSEAAGAAKETALAAARTTIEQEFGYVEQDEPIGTRLRVTANGAMPHLKMPRHEATINAMDAIGLPVVDEIETRRFSTVTIDLDKCNACGMCAVFCTSGALKRDEAKSSSDPLEYLEFSAADCVQCGLCHDVCWKGALSISPIVSCEQLYDFEPVTFDMKAVKKPRKKMF